MLNESISFLNLRFENDVKTYGTQAVTAVRSRETMFENDVKIWSLFVKNSDQRNVAR